MANTVTFKIKIDDSGTVKTVTADADELGKVIDEVKEKAKKLNNELVNSASISQIAEGARDAITQLASALDSLSQAYYNDEEAANTLAKVMSNTMDATADEVEEIKRFVAAQEKVGVVSAGVQTAAARELSTYLTLTSSLKTLIPVLNDMGVHQYGVGVSAEQLTQIATMMGKAMDGQVEALSRAGYKFDDAQKYILKFGEESERAAVLAQVVSESVGGINASSVNTAAGQMQQFRNQMEGVKSSIGSTVASINPFIQGIAGMTIVVANIAQLKQSFMALSAAMATSKLHSVALAAAHRLQAAAERVLTAITGASTIAVKAMKVEIIATEAAITLGLSVGISLLVEGLSRLVAKSGDAADSVEDIGEAQRAYTDASVEAMSSIAQEIVELEDLIKHHKQTGEKITELNGKYGEVFGIYATAAEWYDVLTSKSQIYCQQLCYEAQAKVIASQKAAKELELEAVRAQKAKMKESGDASRKGLVLYKDVDGNTVGWGVGEKSTKAFKELEDQEAQLAADVEQLGKDFEDCFGKALSAQDELKSSMKDTSSDWKKMSLADLTREIQKQKEIVEAAAGSDEKKAKAEAAVLKQMEERKNLLEKTYGLDNGNSGKDKYDGTSLIKNAGSYKELGNNIKYYQTKLEEADASDEASIRMLTEKIEGLKRQQQAIKDVMDAAGRPLSLDTLEDIDKEISYQQGLRKTASKENLAQIDAEIKRLNDLKTAFEQSSVLSLGLEEITTYEQLNVQIEHYSNTLKTAGTKDREQIQLTLNALEKLKKGWDDALYALQKPGDITTLTTIQDLSDAIDYYETIQKRQSGEELQLTQRTIDALSRKKAMMECVASIPTMQRDLLDLNGLQGKELKMELELIGLDNLKGKVRELRKMLADTTNPIDGDARRQVEALANEYENYYNILKRGQISVSQVWGSIRGVGGAIESLTDILTGDGDAWEKICGIMDAGIAIFEGVAAIVDIIKTITKASTVETIANTTATAAQTGVETANSAAAATAAAVTTPLLQAEASAWETLAAARILAAHAEIPFAGVPIATGFIAAMEGIMASVRIPKFANGAIAYGPTFGLFGEYAGAANNPEVVAPLNTLKELIGVDGEGYGEVRFVINGRQLEGIMKKMNRINGRTQ